MVKIKVRNFGPIKEGYLDNDGWIEIKKNTFFIGNQGSGKSTLAKLISTFLWLEKAIYRGDINKDELHLAKFQSILQFHQIHEYVNQKENRNTYLEFIGEKNHFVFDYSTFPPKIDDSGNNTFPIPKIMYAPSERNFLSTIEDAYNIKGLPDNLFSFAEELKIAQKAFKGKKIDFRISDHKYEYDEEYDKSYIAGEEFKIDLLEASSGFQSFVPLYIVSKYLSDSVKNGKNKNNLSVTQSIRMNNEIEAILDDTTLTSNEREEKIRAIRAKYYSNTFVNIVEEPEQNLFPDSQWEMLKALLEFNNQIDGNKLIITTHSPFIINYLPLAIKTYLLKAKVSEDDKLIKKLNEIYPIKSSINPDDIAVYELDEKDGTIKKLEDYKGLPSDENYLNNKLEDVNDTFVQLVEFEDKCR
ncbi:MAG: ATP-binding protein [Bacteroidales bacterium]|nr:ATP-binding protein [Bacteroidales bacterium]MCF8334622.1 ATP-binding protein [Bacteroidales bacterium]